MDVHRQNDPHAMKASISLLQSLNAFSRWLARRRYSAPYAVTLLARSAADALAAINRFNAVT